MIGTVRDTELNDDLDAIVGRLRRERRVERISVGGLDPTTWRALLAARSTTSTPTICSRRRRAIPFMSRNSFATSTRVVAVDRDAIPDSVRDTIARRLLRFPDEVRRLLGIASVCGADFRLPTLARAADADVEVVDDLLDAAVHAGVIAEHPTNIGTYAFSHTLIQTVLRDGLARLGKLACIDA